MESEPTNTAEGTSRPPRQGDQPEKARRRVIAPAPNDQPAVPIGLSPRERQVMEHLAQGLLYKEIADRMCISYGAVHKLQHKIFLKLRVGNRTEAVVKWVALVPMLGLTPNDNVAADLRRRPSS